MNSLRMTFLVIILCAVGCIQPLMGSSVAVAQNAQAAEATKCESCFSLKIPCDKDKTQSYCRACEEHACDECKVSCVICTEDHKGKGETEAVLKCGHIFGKECIEKWGNWSLNASCPSCRANIENKGYIYNKLCCSICQNTIADRASSPSYECEVDEEHHFHEGCLNTYIRKHAVVNHNNVAMRCPCHGGKNIPLLEAASGASLLEQAINDHACEELASLIIEGIALDTTDTQGNTPLHQAVQKNAPSVVRALLARGFLVDVQNTVGNTVLHAAARAGHQAVVKELLEAGAEPFATNNSLETPLHLAAEREHTDVAQELLDAENSSDWWKRWMGHKAGIDLVDLQGRSALDSINRRVRYDWNQSPLETLLQSYNARKGSVTRGAVWRGRALKWTGYVFAGVAIGAITYVVLGQYRLRKAVARGDLDYVKKLLDEGYSAQGIFLGSSLLHIAAEHGHTHIARELLYRGARVEPLLVRYEWASLWRFENGYVDTPLHRAAKNNHGDIVDLLIKAGAHLDAPQVADNKTALHLAAENNHVELVKKLLAAGASSEIKDNYRKTPYDTAQEKKAFEVIAEFDRVG